MHIVQVQESFGSGTLTIVADIVHKTHALGWKTTIFHGVRAETPENFRDLFPNDTVFRRLLTGRKVNGAIDLIDAARIAAYAAANGADIIHGHSSKGGALARLAGLLTQRQAIYTPHGFSFLDENGVNTGKLTYRIEKLLARLPGKFVCCSASEAGFARLLSDDVDVVPNFVDAGRIDAISAASEAPACDVITAGRISRQKNPALFMDVARALPHLRFVWAGGPTDAAEDVPANVEITGWLSREEVLARVARARIFLSTSLYEGMPVSVLEAQALRRPVVATEISGTRDIVSNGITGIFANSVSEICTALERLTTDVELSTAMGANARKMVDERHNSQVNLAQWMDVYRLIGTTSKSPEGQVKPNEQN